MIKNGRELKRTRKKMGVSQHDLAFAIDEHQQKISDLENGRVKRAKKSALAKISYALGFVIENKCLICEKNITGVKHCEAYEDSDDPIIRNGECIAIEIDVLKIGGE